jgi:hypothetical protein
MTGGGTTGLSATGSLANFTIGGLPPSVAGPVLRFRGVNQAAATTHNLALRFVNGAVLCSTPNLAPGASDTFTVTNVAPGSYQVVCTLHLLQMMIANITIT